uniref:Uncharacterized protein n=1 Tax=Pseudomonas phage HRDY3 TaxID=3236930 RepID=A0AB39CE36_9VIRU
MKIILATVNRRQKGESFLESVSMEGPGAQALLLKLFAQREPLTISCAKKKCALSNLDLLPKLAAVRDQVPKGKAAIGSIDDQVFIIVPYTPERLSAALIRSARTFRTLRHPVRLIENERDLLNTHGEVQADPRFKD